MLGTPSWLGTHIQGQIQGKDSGNEAVLGKSTVNK